MKKLKLNIDDLKVESFETTDSSNFNRGTIYGQLKAGDNSNGTIAAVAVMGADSCNGGGGGGGGTGALDPNSMYVFSCWVTGCGATCEGTCNYAYTCINTCNCTVNDPTCPWWCPSNACL